MPTISICQTKNNFISEKTRQSDISGSVSMHGLDKIIGSVNVIPKQVPLAKMKNRKTCHDFIRTCSITHSFQVNCIEFQAYLSA